MGSIKMELIWGLLNNAAPLMLAGLGALLSDLSGALGIFIEGFMICGAFFSWVFTIWTGSAFLGTLISALLAALVGWALARYAKVSGANPFIIGLAFNLAASGLTLSLSAIWFGTKGVLLNPGIRIPAQSTFTALALACIIIAAIGLSRTVPGLRLKASGLAPEAAADRGIRPWFYREGAWALAAFLAALVFSFAERLGVNAQGLGGLPATALLGLPSALALMLYSLSLWFKKRGVFK